MAKNQSIHYLAGEVIFAHPRSIRGDHMMKPTNVRVSLVMGMILLLALAVGPGCQEAKPPPSDKAVKFCQEIQSLIDRISSPLIEPVAQKDENAINTGLIRAFSLCFEACEDVVDSVFVLDEKGVKIAVHPPAKVKGLYFSNYRGVQRAFKERRPVQSTLYHPNGKPIYYVFAPLISQGQVKGILALGFEAAKVREKRGLTWEEFDSLDFRCP